MIYGYYFLLVSCFIVSLFYLRYSTVKWLVVLFFCSIVAEAVVEWMGKQNLRFFVVYHFFILAEYVLVTFALRTLIRRRAVRKLMAWSVLVFVPASLYISFGVQQLTGFPSIAVNFEGLLVIVWCLVALFSIEPVAEVPILRLPAFWIGLAFLIYFAGTLGVNSVYNQLLAHRSAQAKTLFNTINSIFNYILYIFLIIGIACHSWRKNYSAP